MEIYYITSNEGKFEEAQHVLHDWSLKRLDIDLPEIQGEAHDIVREKAKEAFRQVGQPLIVEDVSVYMHALGGLPGPYVKDFLKKLGYQGLYELVHKYDDHRADVSCIAAYIAPGKEPVLFEGIMHGTIVAPRGDVHHGKLSWNSIFLPNGSLKTFGELSIKEHSKMSMRHMALSKLRHYLSN